MGWEPTLLIIVPTLDSYRLLPRLLDSLRSPDVHGLERAVHRRAERGQSIALFLDQLLPSGCPLPLAAAGFQPSLGSSRP